MKIYSKYTLLHYGSKTLHLLWVIAILVSCESGTSTSNRSSADKDTTTPWYNAGNDCDAIDKDKQYTPKDTAELKQLIQKDIQTHGAEVNLNYLDTSAITDMSGLFATADTTAETTTETLEDATREVTEKVAFSTFNGAIHCWDVSNVHTMHAMFRGANAFNQPISNWNVSNVTDMSEMFSGAELFSHDLTDWKHYVQQTVNTEYMLINTNVVAVPDWKDAGICFHHTAHAYVMKDLTELRGKIDALITNLTPSLNLNYLETCNVKDMSLLFVNKKTYNGNITNWDVSNVTDMSRMFSGAEAFNQPIGKWDVSKVKNMSDMFAGAEAFNQPIGDWNVSSATNMRWMFAEARSFNQPIGNWNVSNVSTMRMMFFSADAFNQDISGWNVGNVTNMMSMFAKAKAFNQPIWKWTLNKAENMSKMFDGTESFNQPIGNWNVSRVTDMSYMFHNATAFNHDISGWTLSKVDDMSEMFYNANTFCNGNKSLESWNESMTTQDPSTTDMFTGAGPASCTLIPPQWYTYTPPPPKDKTRD